MAVQVKRAYDAPHRDDGTRVLVDRMWPRGVKKESAAIDQWMRDIAPSTELRKWFGHDPAKWSEFKRKYFHELDANRDALDPLRALVRRERVTLLFAAKDAEHNNAVALAEYLRSGKSAAAASSKKKAGQDPKRSKAKQTKTKQSKAKARTKTKASTKAKHKSKRSAA